MMNRTTLPIDSKLEEICQACFGNRPVILTASPGSGKTTRVPAELLRLLQKKQIQKKILVIVPKRLAAVAASDRIAEENGWTLGKEVGYQVRFESKVTPQTQLIFMTEGYFIKKIHDQSFWESIGWIILDEFHERSSIIDLVLGISFERQLLDPDFKILVMSATLNTEQLQKYFGDSKWIHIDHKPFPLKIIYQKKQQSLVCDQNFYEQVKQATLEGYQIGKKDLLIFLPGLREIQKTAEILKPLFPKIAIEFLYGSMNLMDQKRVLNKQTTQRRIILGTNICESSLTLPDLDVVIDSGLEKQIQYEKKIGFSKLETKRISLFSADQRAGRAARQNEGFCFRLWAEQDRPSFQESKKPEILISNLLEEALILFDLGVKNLNSFSWLDQPDTQQLKSAREKLFLWGLIQSENQMTDQGKFISAIPLELEKSIWFYQSIKEGLHQEMSQVLAIFESISLGKADSSHLEKCDLDYLIHLFQVKKNIKTEQIQKQLLDAAKKLKPNQITSAKELKEFFLDLFLKYFPEKLIQTRHGQKTGVSSLGRGVEYSKTSALSKDKTEKDYVLALSGFEKSDSVTEIKLGLGYSKSEVLKKIKPYITSEHQIQFESDKNRFIQIKKDRYGQFIFSESAPQVLNAAALTEKWKTFVMAEPSVFLNLNSSYEKLKTQLRFLERSLNDFQWELEQEKKLVHFLTDQFENFEDFKNCDLKYYVTEVLPEFVSNQLKHLPDSFQLPNGRRCTINYEDPKAPLISTKLQDCFSLKKSPEIGLKPWTITIELLAPNMRPTQITNNLERFWKTSYADVRKELKARYPKHSWPEPDEL